MRAYFLPVLFWTLAISQSFAQKHLPANTSLPAENWPQSVKKMMRSAGFRLENIPAAGTIQSRSNVLQLDSAKTFIGYDFNGVPDSTPLVRNVFLYPSNGVKVEIESQFATNAWTTVSRQTTHADALGRAVEALGENYDPATGTWGPDSRAEVFPRGNSLDVLDSVKAFGWEPNQLDWVLIFQLKNTFDAQNRLIKSETTIDLDGTPALLVENYGYNAQNDNHLIESFLVTGGFSIPTGRQELLYANHRLIQTINYVQDGTGGSVPTERVTYAYNTGGKVIQQNNYDWRPDLNDWNPTQIQTWEYDNTGRLTATELVTIQVGQPDAKERILYTYLDEENLALESNYLWDASLQAFSLSERNYYYYSGNVSAVSPAPPAVQRLTLSPNPTTGAVQFQLEAPAEIRVYDANGQLRQSGRLQPGASLDLTVLPAGCYQVTARNGAGFYTGKVVKL